MLSIMSMNHHLLLAVADRQDIRVNGTSILNIKIIYINNNANQYMADIKTWY